LKAGVRYIRTLKSQIIYYFPDTLQLNNLPDD